MFLLLLHSLCLKKVYLCNEEVDLPDGYELLQFDPSIDKEFHFDDKIDRQVIIRKCPQAHFEANFYMNEIQKIDIKLDPLDFVNLELDKDISELKLDHLTCSISNNIKIDDAILLQTKFFYVPTSISINTLTIDIPTYHNLEKKFFHNISNMIISLNDFEKFTLYINKSTQYIKCSNDYMISIKRNYSILIDKPKTTYDIFIHVSDQLDSIMFTPNITTNQNENISFLIHAEYLYPVNKIENQGKLNLPEQYTTIINKNSEVLNLFSNINSFKSQKTSPGYYCISYPIFSYQCSSTYRVIDANKEHPVTNLQTNEGNTINIEISETSAIEFPDFDVLDLDNKTIKIVKCPSAYLSKFSLTLLKSTTHLIRYLLIENMQVSVVSLSPVCVSSLMFNNASIMSGVFNPVNLLEIDRDSLSVLDYISEETVGRDVIIDFDEADTIEFEKSEVSVITGKSKYIITKNIGSKVEFIIHPDKLKIDCRSQNVLFAPNISFTSDPVVIFGDSWEFLNPVLNSSTKSVIRTYGNIIHYYSITPTWPSNVFNIIGDVEVSKGGYYCFHSELPNKCPQNYHEIEYKRIPIAIFHKNAVTNTITFYVDQSNSYSSPSISVSALAKLECERLTIMSNELSYMTIVLNSNDEIDYPLYLNYTILTLKKENSSELKIHDLVIMKGTSITTSDEIRIIPRSLKTYEPKFHLFSKIFLNSLCDAEIHFSQNLRKILLGGNNFTIYDNIGAQYRFEPFKSLKLYFENEGYDIIRLELSKEYKEGTNYTIPTIISNANRITFSFHESCYEMTKWKKGLLRNPSGTMTLSTNKAYLPLNNFDIPAESEKVIYDVSKNVTSTPTPSDIFLSTKSIAIIASVVILVIVGTLGLLAVVMKRHAAEKVMVSTDLLII